MIISLVNHPEWINHPVSTGVRQRYLLSPLLFRMVIDWVSKISYSNSTLEHQWTLQTCFEDLGFADDICQLSHRHQDSQEQASNFESNARKMIYTSTEKVYKD